MTVRDLRVAIQAQFTPAGITLALRWTASAAAALIQGYRGPLLKDGSASQDTVQTNGTLRSIRVSPLDTKRFFRVFVGRNASETERFKFRKATSRGSAGGRDVAGH